MPANPKTRLRLKSPLFAILFGIALLMQMIDPYPGWVILTTGLGLTWLACYVWMLSLAGGLSLQREMRFGWSQVGDRLEERFTLHNRSPFPALWVEIRDSSNMPGYQPSRAIGIAALSSTSWRTEGVCGRRGLFTLGPTSLRSGDPFGLYEIQIEDTATATLVVMPPVIPLPDIRVSPGGRAGEARPRSGAPEQTVAAGSVRPYLPGDSLRSIHWRTTARQESPFVRIFDGTPAGDWWIFLDLDQRVQAGQGFNSTIEHGVILAASLAEHGLANRRAVGLVANAQEMVWMPPQTGSGRRWEILRALALVNPTARPLAELLHKTRPGIGRRSSLVLITPNTDADWIEKLLPLIWLGAVPTVLLLDRSTWDENQSQDDVKRTLASLNELNVRCFPITRDLLDRPEARPGREGQWEWRISPFGRAVAVRKPVDLPWKGLG
jgi:uncharacterized protein (DUF58 family)